MYTIKNWTGLLAGAVILAGAIAFDSCKKKEEALPNVDFSASSLTVNEGDTIILNNKTTNGKTYTWSYSGSTWTSSDANTTLLVDSAGSFKISLEAKNGDGKSVTKSVDLTVLPDTVFRLSGNKIKGWWAKSIVYNGNEMLTASCQKDDEFTVYKTASASTDTCVLSEGTNKCPSGTYYFNLPATSQWRYKNGAFEFALTVLGNPVNLSFTITKCTLSEFEGTDSKNNVSMKLQRK